MAEVDLTLAMETARRAVEAAATAALRHFRTSLRVEVKPDRTPVTAADREAEAAALAEIRATFPGHSVLGEESGAHAGDGDLRWLVDPIDGTRGFTRGGSFWGPLVALEVRGTVVAGAMALPALGEVYWAGRGLGCWSRTGSGTVSRERVSGIGQWGEATLSVGEMRYLLAAPLRDPVVELARTAASARCHGDLAGAAMVITGRAEAWIEAGVRPWDLGPIPVLVEEAGGCFTDFQGRPSIAEGRCVASNGRVHAHVLETLGRPAPGS